MDHLLQPALQPYVRLAQSNFALWSEFWTSPGLAWPALATTWSSFPRWSPGPAVHTSAAGQATEAWNHLLKGLLENYSRFAAEVYNSGVSFWNAAPRLTPPAQA